MSVGLTPSSGQSESDLRRLLRRHFTAVDFLKALLSLALGFGIALLTKDHGSAVGLIALAVVMACAAFALDKMRVTTESDLTSAVANTRDEAMNQLKQLRDDLERHIDLVHAGVRFVPDHQGSEDGGPGYDTATAAVRRAQSRIYVVGDYSPPAGEGATLSKPPDERSAYLDAIEDELEKALSGPRDVPLSYHRLIQRPPELYRQISQRSPEGVVLTQDDMAGDLQAFHHLGRVLQIAKSAGANGWIDIQIRLIPFLPNCPSMLLVDNRELQFTIPTRIDQPGDYYALQGLHGVLVMEDRASGSQLCDHFERVFQRLKAKSLPIVNVQS